MLTSQEIQSLVHQNWGKKVFVTTQPTKGKQGGLPGITRTHQGTVRGFENRNVGGEKSYFRYLVLEEAKTGKTLEIPEVCIQLIESPAQRAKAKPVNA